MEIKYDKKIDAKYVYIKKGEIAYTKKEQDWLLFDCAKNGDVLGVEILDASQHLVSLFPSDGKIFWCLATQSVLRSGDENLGVTIDYRKEGQFILVA